MHQLGRGEKSHFEALLPVLETQTPKGSKSPRSTKYLLSVVTAILCCAVIYKNAFPAFQQQASYHTTQVGHGTSDRPDNLSHLDSFRACSIKNFQATQFPFLDGVEPIARDEYVARRQRLAQALLSDGSDAFAVEPGKSAICKV